VNINFTVDKIMVKL